MKLSAHEKSRVVSFSKEQALEIYRQLEELDEVRWFHRTRTYGKACTADTSADYYFLGDKQQPVELNKLIRSLAPSFKGRVLVEACVNKYLPGGYISPHQDIHQYFINIVTPIQAKGDGIEVDGVFYPDEVGVGFAFGLVSPKHSVPAVKHKRYCIIYLYDVG